MNGGQHYNRKGAPISEDEYYEALGRDGNLVAWSRPRGVEVSTVHVGRNCKLDASAPMIFETSYLGEEVHYATEEEARSGHARIVEMIKADPDLA